VAAVAAVITHLPVQVITLQVLTPLATKVASVDLLVEVPNIKRLH
jgi:hypothetical protein